MKNPITRGIHHAAKPLDDDQEHRVRRFWDRIYQEGIIARRYDDLNVAERDRVLQSLKEEGLAG